jgi:hypothetical protein
LVGEAVVHIANDFVFALQYRDSILFLEDRITLTSAIDVDGEGIF